MYGKELGFTYVQRIFNAMCPGPTQATQYSESGAVEWSQISDGRKWFFIPLPPLRYQTT